MLLKASRMVHKMENAGRDIKFEEFKSIRIAYMRRIGEYGVGNKELMERLKSHLRERNLLTPDSILLGIALDDRDLSIRTVYDMMLEWLSKRTVASTLISGKYRMACMLSLK